MASGAEPFDTILADLLRGVQGARAAVFLDDEGEPISRVTNGAGMEPDTIEFIGARQGVIVQALRRSGAHTAQGDPDTIILNGDRLMIVTKRVEREYFLVLAAGPGTLAGRAAWAVAQAARRLREALA